MDNIQKYNKILYIIGGKDNSIHIGDVLDWIEKNTDKIKFDTIESLNNHLIIIWQDKRKSLQPEDTELIDYIFSLII